MPRHFASHIIPLGTSVSFGPTFGSKVYKTSEYQSVIGPCPKYCAFHDGDDCFKEAHIHVTEEIGHLMPLSKLEHIFDQPHHVGRKPTQEELTPRA